MPEIPVRRRLGPEARRQELLDAGERLIRARGAAVRVEDVTSAAAASKGTFYVYFESWDAFLLALRDQAFAGLAAAFDDWVRAQPDWRTLIRGLPDLFVDLTLSLEGLHNAIFHGPIAHVPVSGTRFDVLRRLADLVEQGRAAGALTAADPAMTAHFIFAVTHSAADLVERGHNRDWVVHAFGDLLADTLQTKPLPVAPE